MIKSKNPPEPRNYPVVHGGKFYTFAVAFVGATGGFLFGYDLLIVSGANEYLREQFELSDAEFGFMTVSANLGCITGPFLGAWLCDFIGRKKTLIIASLLLGVSAVLTALPRDILTFNIFRFVGGIGVGLCSIASPMYLVEIAPCRIRGRLGMMFQLAVVVGAIIASIIASIFAKFLAEDICWRWMFASEIVPIIFFVIFLLFVPRSPRWLAQKNHHDEALQVLTRIDGPEYASSELKGIKASLAEETGTFSELFRPGIRMALLVGILLALFNNLTGWSSLGPYLPSLFMKSGFTEKADAIFQFVFVYSFMGIMTAASMWLIDRVGRRTMWLIFSLFMVVSLILMGLVFILNLSGIVVLLAVFLCAIPHAFALGSIPWFMMSELYPTRIRARAVSITTTILWSAGFLGGFIFPILTGFSERTFGTIGPAFFVFSAICVLAFIFGLTLLPETKGKTLEQITRYWMDKGKKRGLK